MYRPDVSNRIAVLSDRAAKVRRTEGVPSVGGQPQRPPPSRLLVPPQEEKNFLERILEKYTRNDSQQDDDGNNENEHQQAPLPQAPAATIASVGQKRRHEGAGGAGDPPPKRPLAVTHKRQPNRLSMQGYMLQLLKADADEEADKLRNTRVHLRWEYEVLNLKFKGECIGDIRIKKKRGALEFIYDTCMKPSKQQRLMHMGIEAISYPSFFGEELHAHMVRILRERNWSEFRTEAIFEAPRRFGKTVAISMDAAAELVTQPGNATSEYGHDICVYSNNHRASKMLLLQTYKFVKVICADPRFGGKIESINKNESIEFHTKDSYINLMYAYPAKPDNLRGTGSKAPTGTVIAEEFAYMPEEVFFGILAPTLTRRNVKFVGITTVNGSDSFVSPLTQAKYPDGRSVFLSLNFQLICAECKAANRAHLCKCLVGDLPPWQSAEQHEKLSIIMEKKIGKFLQEIKGLSIDETVSPAFCQVSCEFLRTPESILTSKQTFSEIIYTAVDPACGGKYSKFAIVSAIFRDNLMIVSALLCLLFGWWRCVVDVLVVVFVVLVDLFVFFLLRLCVPLEIVDFERAPEDKLAQLVDVLVCLQHARCVERREQLQRRHELPNRGAIGDANVLGQSPAMLAQEQQCLQLARHLYETEKQRLRWHSDGSVLWRATARQQSRHSLIDFECVQQLLALDFSLFALSFLHVFKFRSPFQVLIESMLDFNVEFQRYLDVCVDGTNRGRLPAPECEFHLERSFVQVVAQNAIGNIGCEEHGGDVVPSSARNAACRLAMSYVGEMQQHLACCL